MRLHRPYIPLKTRVQVAERQWTERHCAEPDRDACAPFNGDKPYSDGQWLKILLNHLFGDTKVELHHRPALCNRLSMTRGGATIYNPAANNPDYLVYLPADEHDIETRVRGQRGQYSDLAIARKRKRKERKSRARGFWKGKSMTFAKMLRLKQASDKRLKRAAGRPVNTFKASIAKSRKFKWSSRPFPKRRRK